MIHRTYIKELFKKKGESVIIYGWINTRRDQGKMIFLDFRDITGIVQGVILLGSETLEIGRVLREEFVVKWEAACLCVSREAKPAKIVSLIEKENFAGFVRRQAASRWGGFLPVRAEILVQNGFALRSAIATKSITNQKLRIKIKYYEFSGNFAR